MKIKLNRSLRAALLSCYAVAATLTTSLTTGTIAIGAVSFTLLSAQKVQAADTIINLGEGAKIVPESNQAVAGDWTATQTDSITFNFSSGWFGGGTFTMTAPTLYVQNWKQTDGSTSGHYIVNGNLTNPTADAVGNIVFGYSETADHNAIFNGNHKNFSGNFVMAVTANGIDYVFTNTGANPANTDETRDRTNVSGIGAIELGIRDASSAFGANAVARDAIFFYSGDVSISNTAINADALSLNGESAGDNTSAAYKTSRTEDTATNGATYTISSALNVNTLEINDGSTARLIDRSSSAGAISLTSGSQLQIAQGAVLNLTGTSTLTQNAVVQIETDGGLTVAEGATLNVNGKLTSITALHNEGTVNFGSTAKIDITGLTAISTEGDTHTYQIVNNGGTLTGFDTLSYENIAGISGISASSHTVLFNTDGSVSITQLLEVLSYAGGESFLTPSELAWNTTGISFNGDTSAFTPGSSVNFSGHTRATLEENITAGNIALSANSSLTLSGEDSATLSAERVTLDENSQFFTHTSLLNTTGGALVIVGELSSRMTLIDGSITLADTLDLSAFAGVFSLHDVSATITNVSLGNSAQLRLVGADVSLAEGTYSKIIGIGAASSITATGAVTLTGDIEGSGRLTLNGSVNLNTNIDFTGDIIIDDGTTRYGTGEASGERLAASSITVNSGARLNIWHGSADFTGTAMTLNNATLHSDDLDNGAGVRFGMLSVSGTNTISHQWNGIFSFTSLTGEGTLNFTPGGEAGQLQLRGVSNFSGTLNFTNNGDNDTLYISDAITQDFGYRMIVTGSQVTAENIVLSGGGDLSFDSGVYFVGTNTSKAGTLSISALQQSSADNTLTILGGALNFTGAIIDSTNKATINMGAAMLQASEASITIAENFALGAFDAEAGESAGSYHDPIVTTFDTDQSDGGGNMAMSITGNMAQYGESIVSLRVIGSGSLTLSGNNSYQGTTSIYPDATLIAGSTNAFGSGHVIVNGGTLNANGQQLSNYIQFNSGSISGLNNFRGMLSVNSDLTLSNGFSSLAFVGEGHTLSLGGEWSFSQSVQNSGTVILREDLILNLESVVFDSEGNKRIIASTLEGSQIDASAWLLENGSVDMNKLTGVATEGYSYSYTDGVLTAIYSGTTHTVNTPMLDLGVGTVIDGASMENGDKIIVAQDSVFTITGDVSSSTLHVNQDTSLTVNDGEYTLTIDNIALAQDASMTILGSVEAASAYLEAGSELRIAAIGDMLVEAATGGTLYLTETFAAGEYELARVIGGGHISVALDAAGTTVLRPVDFQASQLLVREGMLLGSVEQLKNWRGITLADNSSIQLSETLNGELTLEGLSGGENTLITLTAVGDPSETGDDSPAYGYVSFDPDFKGALQLNGGLLIANSRLDKLILNNSGLIATINISTFYSIQVASESVAYLHTLGSANLYINGIVTGDDTTILAKTGSGSANIMGDMDGFSGALSVREGTLNVFTNIANLVSLSIGDDAQLVLLSTSRVTVNGGVTSEMASTSKVVNHSFDIQLFGGTVLDENVHLRMQTSTINITGDALYGGGSYYIKGFMGADADGAVSELNIGADTSMFVTGDVTTADSDANPLGSFMLTHWGMNGARTTVNVSGLLDITAGISNKDGTGLINVESGGTLVLGQGLYVLDNDSDAAAVTLTVKDGATVKLRNQATNTAAGVFVVDFAGGSAIEALDVTTNITNAIRLSGTGAVTLSADAAATQINVDSVISEVEGSTSTLNISALAGQRFSLSAANTFTTGINVAGAGTLSVENTAALGTGALSFDGAILDLNDRAVDNAITANGGTLSNFAKYTGDLTISGIVDTEGTLTGSVSVQTGASLILNSIYKPVDTIENAGTLTLGADLRLDLSDISLAEGVGIELFKNKVFSSNLDIDAFAPAGVVAHDNIIGAVTIGRDYTLTEAGVLSYTLTGDTHTSTTATLDWEDGTAIGAGTFANEDSVIFSTTDVVATLGGSVLSAQVTVETGLTLTVESADPAYTLGVGEIILQENASMIVDKDIDFSVAIANLAAGSSLSMAELGLAKVTLTDDAALILTVALAAGGHTLEKVYGGDTSSLSLASAATGDESVSLDAPNFTGNLTLTDGAFSSNLAQHESYASVHLLATSRYELTDTLGAAQAINDLSADAGGLLTLNLSAAADAGTTLTLDDTFLGDLEVKSGVLSAFSTILNVGQVTFNDGTSLVFNHSTNEHTFTPNVVLADGANVSIRTWGLITGTELRQVDGAVIGEANTTLTKTDAGLTQLNNIENFKGSIVLENGVGGAGKLIINSNATALSNITLEASTLLDITGAGNIVNTASYSGGSTTQVDAGASLVVTGADASATEGEAASFHLVGTVNVEGILSVNSAISNQAAAGTINVEDGGTLVLHEGLYTVYNANASTINAKSGSSVELGHQVTASTQASGAETHLIANFESGSTITAIDVTTDILNNTNITGAGVVTLTADVVVTNVNVEGIISGTAALEITGAAGQEFSLNAANTYTGLTSVAGGVTLVVGHANALSASTGLDVVNGAADFSQVAGISINGILSLNADSTLIMNQVNGGVALGGLSLTANEKSLIDFNTPVAAEFDVLLFEGLTADGSITGITFDVEGKADASDYFTGLAGELTYDKLAGTLRYNNYDLDNIIWKGGAGNFSDADGWETKEGVLAPLAELPEADKSITFETTDPTALPASVVVDGSYSVVNMTVTGAGADYTFNVADMSDSLAIQEKLVVDAGARASFSFNPVLEDGISVLVGTGSSLTLNAAGAISIDSFTSDGTFTALGYDLTLESATESDGDISVQGLSLAVGDNSFKSVTTTGIVSLGKTGTLELSAASSMAGGFYGGGSLNILGTTSLLTLGNDATALAGSTVLLANGLTTEAGLTVKGNVLISNPEVTGELRVLDVAGALNVIGNIQVDSVIARGSVNVTGTAVLNEMESYGAVTFEAGAQITDSLISTGTVTFKAVSSVGTLDNAEVVTFEAIGNNTIGTLKNSSSITSVGNLEITEIATGGNLTVGRLADGAITAVTSDLTLAGDASFDKLIVTGDISSIDNTLSLGADSQVLGDITASSVTLREGSASIGGVNSDIALSNAGTGTLSLGADATVDTFHNAGTVDIDGGLTVDKAVTTGGILITKGDVALSGTSSFTSINMDASRLVLGGALSLSGSLTTAAGTLSLHVGYDAKAGPVLTAQSVAGATGLELGISFNQLNDLGLSHEGSYTLTEVDAGFLSSYTLSFAETENATWSVENRTFTLGVDADTLAGETHGQITITLTITGNTWQSVDGNWDDRALNWSGNVPQAGDTAYFLGAGSLNVVVDGDKEVGELRVQGAYNFSGDNIIADSFIHTSSVNALDPTMSVTTVSNQIQVNGLTTISNADTVLHLITQEVAPGVMQGGVLHTEYLNIVAGAMLKLDASSTLYVGLNAADAAYVNDISGTIENDGQVALYGLEYNITTLIGSAGELEIHDGADVEIGTLEQASVTLAAGATLDLTGASDIGVLLGDAGDVLATELTISGEGSDSTAHIAADELTIDLKGNSLGTLNVGTLILNADLVDGADALLAVSSIEGATAGSAFSLSFADQLLNLGEGSYSLLSSTGTLSWGELTMDNESLAEIQDLVRSGLDISYTEDGGTLGFTLSEATNRIWTVSNDYAVSEGLDESSQNAIKPMFEDGTLTANSGALANYRVLDSVDTVIVDRDFTLDLSTQPADINGAVLRDTMGSATLSLVGGKATLENSGQSLLHGLTLDGTELDVHRDGVAGSLSISTLSAEGADISVSEGGRLSVTNATLTDSELTVGDGIVYSGNASSLTVSKLTLNGTSSVTVLATTSTNRALTNPVALTVTEKLTLDDSSSHTVDTGAASRIDQLDANDDSEFIVKDGGQAYIGSADLAANAALSATGTGYIEIDEISASVETNSVEGHIILGNGTYNGTYSNATTFETKAYGTTSLTTDSMLSVVGGVGSHITLVDRAADNSVNSLNTTGSTVVVEKNGLLVKGGTMTDSTLMFKVDAAGIVDQMKNGTIIDLLDSNSQLSLSGTQVVIGQTDDAVATLDFTGIDTSGSYTLFDVNASGLEVSDISLAGSALSKYFSGASLNGSALILTFNQEAYVPKASSANGVAGAKLLSPLIFATQTGDLKDVLDSMDALSGNAADSLAAAVAGASVTSLGSSMLSSVERQLQNVRNRTMSMGGNEMADTHGPVINAWIAAEGSYNKLDDDGTAAGHDYSTFGGSFGVDVAVDSQITLGAVFTSLYGTVSSSGADSATGDLNTYNVSAFARVTHGQWSHSFVATLGLADASLKRTVAHGNGSYTSEGDTDGFGLGLMYEVGYSYIIGEEESMLLQPVFNVSLVHASISAYTEEGSDASLEVGDQENSYATFGIGARFEAIVGASTFNCDAVFSSRAMVKFDAGERNTDAQVNLAGQSASGTVTGAEAGNIGLELGAGLHIPVGVENGTIFMDAGVEFRKQQSNVNGSVGYRFSF